MYLGKRYTSQLLRMLKLQQESSFRKILFTSSVGVYLHLFLDWPLHMLLDLGIVPVELTPIGLVMYAFCVFSFFVGVILYKRRVPLKRTDRR